MSFLYAAMLLAQEAGGEVIIDSAQEGKKVIIGMLITGLIFVAVIALGQLGEWAAHRRQDKRARRAY
jgi:hypothetical protein